jgi:hypothetical protein
MSECITGQSFDWPGGKLPTRWIIASFIKFELEARLDGDHHRPRFLTPLVATAHTVLQKPCTGTDCITDLEDA